MSRHLIIDLSNNNGDVDLGPVRAAGIDGMWHKVSEGLHFVDRLWTTRRDYGRKQGLRVGGYHFARGAGSAEGKAQALAFVEHLGPLKRRDLAPVLDLELADGAGAKGLVEYARAFNHEVRHQLGVWPVFYSYASFVTDLHLERVLGRGLWLAAYGRNDGIEHQVTVPAPYKKALAHQFTSNAKVAGVHGRCDLSSAPRLVPLLAHGWRGL